MPWASTVNNSINPAPCRASTSTTPACSATTRWSPALVGFQGLGNLGVGRVSPTSTIGGFVFSAASDSVNLLVRALKTQGRIDILSRPQIMTLDNQTALINVGQEIPIVTSSNVTATGIIQTNIERRNVGVILQVTPKINPDGSVLMRVVPEISSIRDPASRWATAWSAPRSTSSTWRRRWWRGDGETVAHRRPDHQARPARREQDPLVRRPAARGRAVPLPRTSRNERGAAGDPDAARGALALDADRVLAEESQRIDWILSDVIKVHGTSGMGPILGLHGPPAPTASEGAGPTLPMPQKLPDVPVDPAPALKEGPTLD